MDNLYGVPDGQQLQDDPGDHLDATLIDLSQPMLDRARERASRATSGRITTVQADIREVKPPDGEFDIVLAAAVLHHPHAVKS